MDLLCTVVGTKSPDFTGHTGGTHRYCKPLYRGDKHVWRIDKQEGTNTLWGLNILYWGDKHVLVGDKHNVVEEQT